MSSLQNKLLEQVRNLNSHGTLQTFEFQQELVPIRNSHSHAHSLNIFILQPYYTVFIQMYVILLKEIARTSKNNLIKTALYIFKIPILVSEIEFPIFTRHSPQYFNITTLLRHN